MIDPNQGEAMKGLIKGFANDEFKIALENMRYNARSAGFLEKGELYNVSILPSEPLESR